MKKRIKSFLVDVGAFINIFIIDLWFVWFVIATFFVVIWVTTTSYELPGTGTKCKSCQEECLELGKKLGTETKYIRRCWVKGWAMSHGDTR